MRKIVRTSEEVEHLIKRIKSGEVYGFDSESSGPLLIDAAKPGKTKNFINMYRASLTGMSFAFQDAQGKESWYVPVGHHRNNLDYTQAKRIAQAMKGLWGTGSLGVCHSLVHELLAVRELVDLHDAPLSLHPGDDVDAQPTERPPQEEIQPEDTSAQVCWY